MSENGWYLDDSSSFDTWNAAITGVGRNTHAQAAPLYNVQRPAISEAYTTADIASSGTVVMTFSLPVGTATIDTVIIPGFQVLGDDIANQDRPRSINTKPTGTLALTGITPEAPNNDGAVYFERERLLSREVGSRFQVIQVDTWRGWACLTIPKAARSSLAFNLAINAGQTFRVVIPRIMAGVRYTPPKNFVDGASFQKIDPVRIGQRQGAFVADTRLTPYKTAQLTYQDLPIADLERFQEMQSAGGKVVPLVALPRPGRLSSMMYARMLDLPYSYDLYDADDAVDHNTVTVNLEEISRDA